MRSSKKNKLKNVLFKEIKTGKLIKGRLVMGVDQEKQNCENKLLL